MVLFHVSLTYIVNHHVNGHVNHISDADLKTLLHTNFIWHFPAFMWPLLQDMLFIHVQITMVLQGMDWHGGMYPGYLANKFPFYL